MKKDHLKKQTVNVQAIQDMLARIGGPLNLAILVPMLHEKDKEISTQRLHALFTLIGRPAANYLVVCLELEEDRNRRQQLLSCFRVGFHRIPGTSSPLWYPGTGCRQSR